MSDYEMVLGEASGGSGSSSSIDYGALGTGGGLIGGLTSFYQPFISQHWAANANREAWHRQLYMAKHGYQFAVKDLMKAGLNPALAYTKGAADTGNVQQQQVPNFDSDGDIVGRAISSGRQGSEYQQRLQLMREELEQTRQATKRSHSETETAAANAREADARAVIAAADRDIAVQTKDMTVSNAAQGNLQTRGLTQQMMMDLELQRSQLPSAKAMAEFDASPAGQLLLKAGRALGPASSAAGMIPQLRSLRKAKDIVETTEGFDARGEHTATSIKRRSNR